MLVLYWFCPPLYFVFRCVTGEAPKAVVYSVNTRKAQELGVTFTDFQDSLKESIASLVELKLVEPGKQE